MPLGQKAGTTQEPRRAISKVCSVRYTHRSPRAATSACRPVIAKSNCINRRSDFRGLHSLSRPHGSLALQLLHGAAQDLNRKISSNKIAKGDFR